MTICTKTQRIFNLVSEPGPSSDSALYLFYCDEEASLPDSTLHIEPGLYEDLGWPNVVTVTVEPGDLLNG